MRGLSRLTNLTNGVIAQMDAMADSVATDIQAAADEIKTCMDGYVQVRDQMKATAAEARATLNALTNGLPTETPATPPAPPAG